MTRSLQRLRAAGTAILAAATLAACGGDATTTASPKTGVAPSSGLEHVHGLGVNPRDGALVIATHTGLFRAARGAVTAAPYGRARQDVMGFSVMGPDRFIGSGHPDPRNATLPPNLGLIESRDGGRTFGSVSLLGAADFHVLESRDKQVYGFDGTQGRLMVSRDGGRHWTRRTPPGPLIALAIDPSDARRVVAATAAGLQASDDEGRTWRRLSGALGLLAWPDARRLYLIDGTGQVRVSADRGRAFHEVGTIRGQPAAFTAHEDELYAALAEGVVVRSADGGTTWQVRARP